MRLVALANFMRLSLLKAAHVVAGECRVAGIRVRSGSTASRDRRDDNSVGPLTTLCPTAFEAVSCKKFVIPTGAQRSGEPALSEVEGDLLFLSVDSI
jgi:hypothetical protein